MPIGPSRAHRLIVAALLSLACSHIAFAQAPHSRDLAGRVLDATGLPVPGATVTLRNVSTGFDRFAVVGQGRRLGGRRTPGEQQAGERGGKVSRGHGFLFIFAARQWR